MTDSQAYFQYLTKKSFIGGFYRRFFLYPKINCLLKGRTLDVGCGIGDMLKFRPNSVGVDINPFNVEFCRSLDLEAHLMQVDQLPFNEASFDSLLLDNVLEHISDPVPLLKEVKRVMRTDGLLVIGVPGLKGQLCDLDHKAYYHEADLCELANRLGFTIEKFMYTPLFKSTLFSRTIKQYCIYSQWTLKT